MSIIPPLAVPYVPESIRVHLGSPASDATNVTVPFVDYIKNVASSELYPDWPEDALRANIYAIISYTLNRTYTEWYPSRGYDFDITNTTQFDQAFVNGRNYFENTSNIVDEIFNSYLKKPGQNAPFFAQYCDGRISACEGMSQWGSVALAEQGMSYIEILKYYYGDDIEIVENIPVLNKTPSYPGAALRLGSEGIPVRTIQIVLNLIRQTYSAIPPIPEENGIFDEYTEAAVKKFQSIFELTPDGIVGNATWYSMIRLVVSIFRLAELNAASIDFDAIGTQFDYELSPGDTGFPIELMQYYLQYIAQFNGYVSSPERTGTYDSATEQAVRDFQRFSGLPQTGIIDKATGEAIYNAYAGSFERG